LREFYWGNRQPGLKRTIEDNLRSLDAREITAFELGRPTQGDNREPIVLRVGRYGPYLEQGERGSPLYRRAAVPSDLPPDELTLEKAVQLLEQSAQTERPIGVDPNTGRPVFVKQGRFGPYVQLGADEQNGEKPKSVSLLKGMDPSQVTLQTALELLALPKTLGTHPETGEEVVVANGRWGPYVKCGSETRSLPPDISPLKVTLEEALQILSQPKRSVRARRAAAEPLKTFGVSPHTGKPIQLLAGRYGPYVTDGEVNATLPKGTDPETVTQEQAISWLEAKRQAGTSRRRGGRRAKGQSSDVPQPVEPIADT